MATKTQLAKLYKDAQGFEKQRRADVKEKSELKKEIIKVALSHQFQEIPELVQKIEDLEISITRNGNASRNRYDKIRELGYSTSDAYYYATGIRAYTFGGQAIPVKSAS